MVSWKLLTERLLKCLDSSGIIVDGLYLFGSQARGEATAESDIDVLVVSPSFARQRFWSRCTRIGEAIGDLDAPVQLYPVTPKEFTQPEPGGFVESIRPQLKVLFQKGAA